ncbi:MAG: hypothetical protein ABIU11_01105 [Chitinophagaceae bacterium]
MKIISSKMHGIIDYLFSAFVLAAPTIFQMESTLCTITYAIGATHLILTALTDFEVGIFKLIPFRIHGIIEIVVAIGLAGLAIWFNNNSNGLGFYFYITLSVLVLLVFILTDFTTVPRNTNKA